MADGALGKEALAQVPPALQAIVDSGDLSGFVTAVWRNGELAQLNTIGWRNVEEKAPMQRDTIFRIASMSKPVTSVAALQLIEEGKIKLEDPIIKWLPEFTGMKVMNNPTGAVEDVSPAAREITVADLFTHSSGFAYNFTAEGALSKAYDKALGSPLANSNGMDGWLKALATLPLMYQPGDRFHYGQSTDVLGFLVARVDGKTLGQSLKARIFDPLGMKDTAFYVPPEKKNRAAGLYGVNPKTDKLERQAWDIATPNAPPPFEGGGGGLWSTVDDYLTFARMLLNNGELNGVRLLKPETVKLMRTNRLTDRQRQFPFMGMPFWLGQGFGLGVSVVTEPEKNALGVGGVGAFGWPGAFGTWWQADPTEDLIMIYMIQNNMDLSPEGIAALASGNRMAGRMALPTFQRAVYTALGK